MYKTRRWDIPESQEGKKKPPYWQKSVKSCTYKNPYNGSTKKMSIVNIVKSCAKASKLTKSAKSCLAKINTFPKQIFSFFRFLCFIQLLSSLMQIFLGHVLVFLILFFIFSTKHVPMCLKHAQNVFPICMKHWNLEKKNYKISRTKPRIWHVSRACISVSVWQFSGVDTLLKIGCSGFLVVSLNSHQKKGNKSRKLNCNRNMHSSLRKACIQKLHICWIRMDAQYVKWFTTAEHCVSRLYKGNEGATF